MKKQILLLAIVFFGLNNLKAQHTKKDGSPDMRYSENKTPKNTNSNSNTNSNTIHIDSYQKGNGTSVKEHDRTAPNNTNHDNWSTSPNVNPQTGKKGTKKPN